MRRCVTCSPDFLLSFVNHLRYTYARIAGKNLVPCWQRFLPSSSGRPVRQRRREMRNIDRGSTPAESDATRGSSLDERATFLRQVEMFAGLDRITLAKLAAHLEPVPVADGAELCRQGEEGDALYIISRGAFGVYAAAPG